MAASYWEEWLSENESAMRSIAHLHPGVVRIKLSPAGPAELCFVPIDQSTRELRRVRNWQTHFWVALEDFDGEQHLSSFPRIVTSEAIGRTQSDIEAGIGVDSNTSSSHLYNAVGTPAYPRRRLGNPKKQSRKKKVALTVPPAAGRKAKLLTAQKVSIEPVRPLPPNRVANESLVRSGSASNTNPIFTTEKVPLETGSNSSYCASYLVRIPDRVQLVFNTRRTVVSPQPIDDPGVWAGIEEVGSQWSGTLLSFPAKYKRTLTQRFKSAFEAKTSERLLITLDVGQFTKIANCNEISICFGGSQVDLGADEIRPMRMLANRIAFLGKS